MKQVNDTEIEIQGKATLDKLEKLHGKIADMYDSMLNQVRLSKDITKENLALLKQAQDFVKANDIVVDITSKGTGKQLNSKIQEQLERLRNDR